MQVPPNEVASSPAGLALRLIFGCNLTCTKNTESSVERERETSNATYIANSTGSGKIDIKLALNRQYLELRARDYRRAVCGGY